MVYHRIESRMSDLDWSLARWNEVEARTSTRKPLHITVLTSDPRKVIQRKDIKEGTMQEKKSNLLLV